MKQAFCMRTALCLVLISVLGSMVSALAGENKNVRAGDLLAAAHARENIMADGTPPYALRVRITPTGQLASYPDGTYEIRFASPDYFQTKITFGEHVSSEGKDGDVDKIWSLQSEDSTLFPELIFTSASNPFTPMIDRTPTDSLKVKHKKENGKNVDCVEGKGSLEICIDANTGVIVKQRGDFAEYQYTDFRPWGKILIPGEIAVLLDRQPILVAKIVSLEALPPGQATPSSFVQPPHATELLQASASCDAQAPRISKATSPTIPSIPGGPTGNGSVIFWGEIDKTGRVTALVLAHSAGKAFDEAARQAVQQWHYAPATLCEKPADSTSTFRVNFR